MDKPIAVGMAILDLSKVVMYEYYYNFLKKKIWRQDKTGIYRYRYR